MCHTEKVHFIQKVLNWQKGSDIWNSQRCLIFNFGYKETFPHPEIILSLKPNFLFNVGTFGLHSPHKCSIVVIGGKYLNQIDKVMRMVDKITEDTAWMPSAVFLVAEKPGQDIKFTLSTRHRRSPTMYQVPATRSSVVQFVMTCPGMSHSSTFTLHMRDNGEVDDGKMWGNLCREKKVNIAYNNDPGYFEVDDRTGEMVKYPVRPVNGEMSIIPYDWEILHSFFSNHDIVHVWINCHFTWGSYEEESGRWTGAVGKVRIVFLLFIFYMMNIFLDTNRCC